MEDVLEVYQRPYDPSKPKVCMEEGSKQSFAHTREPIPMEAGQAESIDDEYERKGVCSVFVAVESETGACHLQVSKHRTRQDWARFVRDLLLVRHPRAEKLVLVMDNLNTHTFGWLYETFSAEEAQRLCLRLEIHSTPKHRSWLNMAEIELSALGRQCLNRRLATLEEVAQEVQAWQEERNQAQATIHWRFTAKDARIKLKRLYPSIDV